MTGVSGLHPVSLSYDALYLVFLHETGYSWARSPDALFPELKTNSGATIAALALLIHLLNLRHEFLLFELPQTYRMMKPLVIATGTNFEYFAHLLRRETGFDAAL